MPEQFKCHLGRKCLVHGFNETASRLLVNRAFELIVTGNFTTPELVELRRVSNGK
jgi:hypothetical protein